MWSKLSNYRDVALLFFRLTFGPLFIYVHGLPKLAGGLAEWRKLGAAMHSIGIYFWPGFWGFMAAFSETIGVALLIIGFAFRPSCLLLVITLAITAWSGRSHGLHGESQDLELLLVFVTFMFIGAGKYSVDKS